MSDIKVVPSAALRGAGEVAAENLKVQIEALSPDTPPSIRERLAEGLQSDLSEAGMSVTLSESLTFIDNRLTELESPSEGTLAAGDEAGCDADRRQEVPWPACWQAMIQYIKDGGQ